MQVVSILKVATIAIMKSTKKIRTSFLLSDGLYNRCRAAVAALGTPPVLLTISKLVEDSLEKSLKELEEKYNKGKPFPEFTGRIKTGRPVGS